MYGTDGPGKVKNRGKGDYMYLFFLSYNVEDQLLKYNETTSARYSFGTRVWTLSHIPTLQGCTYAPCSYTRFSALIRMMLPADCGRLVDTQCGFAHIRSSF